MPLGFFGWLLVRLDIPDRLVPGYLSWYHLSLMWQPVYMSGDPVGNVMTEQWTQHMRQARIVERPSLLMIPIVLLVDTLIFAWQWSLEHTLGYIMKRKGKS